MSSTSPKQSTQIRPVLSPTHLASSRGNRYIMVGIHLDANYIFVEPMKNRTEGEMIQAYQLMINRMRRAGLGLRKHKLDNEASEAFKDCINENGMKYELVPPGNHRCNQAECAIQTFKAHFISILAGVDNKFPLSLSRRPGKRSSRSRGRDTSHAFCHTAGAT